MNLTQEQISKVLLDLASEKDGYRTLLKKSLEAIMKAERQQFQNEHSDYGNGYRFSKVCVHNGKMELAIPRTRHNNFYPMILALIKDQNKECESLAFELYRCGLTTEQVGGIFKKLYDHKYSKSAISQMMNSAKTDVFSWLERKGLDETYPVIYIDATFWHTRRDKTVSNEAYYTILGVKQDTTREVLAVVNHPTEGAGNWVQIFEKLKERGVKRIQLVVSDGLTGIENAIQTVYPMATVQLCIVHLMRNILNKVKPKHRSEIKIELKKILSPDNDIDSPEKGLKRFLAFVAKWEKIYPSLKQYKEPRYALYFNYLGYEKSIRRMIYTTNWIERLHRNYKRTLRMRTSLPNPEAVLFLMGSTAMNRPEYNYPIYQFSTSSELDFY